MGSPVTSTTIDLYGIECRFALNPRVQLTAFYQENSNNNSRNYNIWVSWEYQPLSYVYFVFNHRGFDGVPGKFQKEDHVIAKVSYLKQF